MNSLSAACHRRLPLAIGVIIAAMFIVGGCDEIELTESGDQLDSSARPAAGGVAGLAAPAATAKIPPLWYTAPIGAVLALIFAYILYRQVKQANPGTRKMQEIAGYVTTGAYAYLKRQYKVVAIFFIIVAALLYVLASMGLQHKVVWFAFLTGGVLSALCGFLGMKTATMASNRTAQGAKEGLNRGLTIAFRAGAVMGLVVVGFALFYISLWFLVLYKIAPAFGYKMSLVEITVVMLTFAMGASSQALFARVGGGIFTKAADVGADLVGKVEAGIPEDDPRNPATIADNVGDNVGDVAGMGADLFESYCGSILAAAALGVAAAWSLGIGKLAVNFLAAPMALAGVGIMLSIAGIYAVRTKENATMKQLMGALSRGINGASIAILVAALGICYWLLGGDEFAAAGVRWLHVWGSIVVGLVAGVVIGKGAEYATSYDYAPTREVARSAETGAGTVVITGIAEGMKSTWMAMLTVIVAVMAAFCLAGGYDNIPMGLYGVGIAAVGMLATLGITLATDAYGPIADNAGGNAEMTGQPAKVRKRTDALDSLGNTTAAIGKGFAIGSATLTALALLASYVEQIRVAQIREGQTAFIRHVGLQYKGGDALYIRAGKLVLAEENDAGNVAPVSYMLLSKKITDIEPGSRIVFSDLTAAGEDNVRRGTLAYGTGGSAAVQMVASSRASLAQYMRFYDVVLMNPKVLCGLFAGVMLVFVFSALTIKAVGRTANTIVKEVRRQFRQIKGIMTGEGKPDYARCVDIATIGAQKAMVVPSLLALVVPVVVGLLLGVAGVMGLIAGGLTCGFALAIFMANAGGAWDNAKKYIETGKMGGKGSDSHKASVVGDTVGDPFKDTSGPSLNILIKLISIVSIVFAGVIVKYAPQIGEFLGMK